MPSTALPLTDASGTRRETFLALVRAEGTMHALDSTPDNTLVTIGTGLAIEAFEGRYRHTRDVAAERFGIPGDVVEFLTAAALATLTPTMGAAVLTRPNEATLDELLAWLASLGLKTTQAKAGER